MRLGPVPDGSIANYQDRRHIFGWFAWGTLVTKVFKIPRRSENLLVAEKKSTAPAPTRLRDRITIDYIDL
jgi:hypothetical protein